MRRYLRIALILRFFSSADKASILRTRAVSRRRKGSIPSCRDSRPAIMILFLIPLFPDLLRFSRRQNLFSRERRNDLFLRLDFDFAPGSACNPASMRSLVTIGFPGIRTARQHSGGTDDGNISFPGFLSPGGTHTLHSSKGCMARLGGAWQQLFSYPKDTKKKPNAIRKNLIFSYPGNNKRELSRTLIRTDMSVQVQTS